MAVACGSPDPSLGVAVRLADYLDCHARALGENGFQALAGGPVAAGLLSGLVTIFVALIGYRMLLGQTPGVRDGVGWAVRLGIVLALATGWPAFQALVYRVAVDGPGEVAGVLLPAAGLPGDGLDARVQAAYDTIRLGTVDQPAAVLPQQAPSASGQPGEPGATVPAPPANPLFGEPPRPQTASLFVVTTSGFMAALRVAAGFLLALGPLAIMSLLFDATLGVFSGWVRGLGGAALALAAATVVTALHLLAIESELANLEAARVGATASATVDAQGLFTIVLLFAVVMLAAVWAAARMAGAFRLDLGRHAPSRDAERRADAGLRPAMPLTPAVQQAGGFGTTVLPTQTRVGAVADALATTVRREQLLGGGAGGTPETPSRRISIAEGARGVPGIAAAPLGAGGRRSPGRRTRSAARRDRPA